MGSRVPIITVGATIKVFWGPRGPQKSVWGLIIVQFSKFKNSLEAETFLHPPVLCGSQLGVHDRVFVYMVAASLYGVSKGQILLWCCGKYRPCKKKHYDTLWQKCFEIPWIFLIDWVFFLSLITLANKSLNEYGMLAKDSQQNLLPGV